MRTCKLCNKEIKLGDSAIKLVNGTFEKDDFGGRGFDEAKEWTALGFVHFTCFGDD